MIPSNLDTKAMCRCVYIGKARCQTISHPLNDLLSGGGGVNRFGKLINNHVPILEYLT